MLCFESELFWYKMVVFNSIITPIFIKRPLLAQKAIYNSSFTYLEPPDKNNDKTI